MRKVDYKIMFVYTDDKNRKARQAIFPSHPRSSRMDVEEEFRAFRARSGYTDAFVIFEVTKTKGDLV